MVLPHIRVSYAQLKLLEQLSTKQWRPMPDTYDGRSFTSLRYRGLIEYRHFTIYDGVQGRDDPHSVWLARVSAPFVAVADKDRMYMYANIL